eukprot:TRINITY_DN1480_c0_g1_i1.p4 TRINITY_DN1480_c0_g1~~TRINITY_DN1480_c0_g1_i1.p4  ORF type:complete len:153 (+),score=17.36 TRINITY_DN1480_c0_g1_i1:242-700(+)
MSRLLQQNTKVVAPARTIYNYPKTVRTQRNFLRRNLVCTASTAPYERISGLQEFASAIWERQRRIPKNTFNDPLMRLFEEFDADGDGHITAVELAQALQSRGVQINEEQAQGFIDTVDKDGNRTVEKNEFPRLIFRMASSDRLSSSMASLDA